MRELKLGSLFDGIGGFPLAAAMNQCGQLKRIKNNKYCSKVDLWDL